MSETDRKTRKQRAQNRYIRLVYLDADNTKAVQKKTRDGDWGDAHIIETDGSDDAVSCTCPDWKLRKPDGGCYHQHAYNDWTFDEIILASGRRIEL